MKNIVQLTFFLIGAWALLMLSSCYEQEGCQDPDAVNYDPLAELDNNTCTFPNMAIGFAPVLQVVDTVYRDSIFIDPATSLPDTVRVRALEDKVVRVAFGQQIELHREDNGYKVRLDSAHFTISDMVLTTAKQTFAFDTATVLDIDKKYLIEDGLKVADVIDASFNVHSMNIQLNVDANRDDEYDETLEFVDLSNCMFSAAPIRVLPNGHIVDRVNQELIIGLDLEQFFKLNQLGTPASISCPNPLTNEENIFIFK